MKKLSVITVLLALLALGAFGQGATTTPAPALPAVLSCTPSVEAPAPIQTAGIILNPDGSSSTLNTAVQQAQSNAYYAVSQLVSQLNAAKVSDFGVQWSTWSANYLVGKATLDTMPKPPAGYVVACFADPTTGAGNVGPYTGTVVQWPYPSQTGGPVVAAPAVPARPKVQPEAWFQANGGNTINCAVGDTAPVGYVATDAGGAKWVKTLAVTPFGTACFYVKGN